jgi:hypothetical protein
VAIVAGRHLRPTEGLQPGSAQRQIDQLLRYEAQKENVERTVEESGAPASRATRHEAMRYGTRGATRAVVCGAVLPRPPVATRGPTHVRHIVLLHTDSLNVEPLVYLCLVPDMGPRRPLHIALVAAAVAIPSQASGADVARRISGLEASATDLYAVGSHPAEEASDAENQRAIVPHPARIALQEAGAGHHTKVERDATAARVVGRRVVVALVAPESRDLAVVELKRRKVGAARRRLGVEGVGAPHGSQRKPKVELSAGVAVGGVAVWPPVGRPTARNMAAESRVALIANAARVSDVWQHDICERDSAGGEPQSSRARCLRGGARRE